MKKDAIQVGDWMVVDGNKKKCFGIHFNGNYLMKNAGHLVQVPKSRVQAYA
jgi:hypothetical protein